MRRDLTRLPDLARKRGTGPLPVDVNVLMLAARGGGEVRECGQAHGKRHADQELRYRMLTRTNPQKAEALLQRAAEAIDRRWRLYEDFARLT
ncbi:MAG TPA: hypothetical protein VKQ05_14105 [Gemmatimonadales bacterium]|nr:hypothetical protein [Gemmatimonadales bacterium]